MRSLMRALRRLAAHPPAERRWRLRLVLNEVWNHGLTAALVRARHRDARDGNGTGAYRAWLERHTPGRRDLARWRTQSAMWPYRPQISILTPVFETDPRWLAACAESVVAQVYPHWQWCVANDGSTSPGTVSALARIARRDSRIVVVHARANGGIAAATNLALEQATGEYVALMDSDDALLPHALWRVVEHLNRPGDRPDVIYTDEDKLDAEGRRVEPYFKPDWSPDLFLSNMYACHLLVARRSLVEQVGGFRSAFDFSQDYDLMLRLVERANRVDHVADILYHWRKVPQSGATVGNAKPTAHLAGRRALEDALARRRTPGTVEDAGPPGFYRVRYRVEGAPEVSLLPGPGVDRASVAALADRASGTARVEVAESRAAARGAVLVVVGRHLRAAEGWLDPLLELVALPEIGAVGPRILDPDGRVHELGLVLRPGPLAVRMLAGWPASDGGYFGSGITIRNVSAVGGACLVTRREVYGGVGGLDWTWSADAAAIDFCLRVQAAGLRVAVTPWTSLTAADGTAGAVFRFVPEEARALVDRWHTRFTHDPYLSIHLDPEGLQPRADPISAPGQPDAPGTAG